MGDSKSERCLMLAELELDTCWDWHPCSSMIVDDIEDDNVFWKEIRKEKHRE